MEVFLQRLVDGLSYGSVYALIALGLVIIYRGTGHLNFAQGEMALFATYCVYQFGEWGIPVWIALFLGMGVGFGLAQFAVQRAVAGMYAPVGASVCLGPAHWQGVVLARSALSWGASVCCFLAAGE